MRLVPQRSARAELLDRRDHSARDLRAALEDIARTNAWLGGRRALLSALRPLLLESHAPLEVLDVGTGGADLPLYLLRRARELGREAIVTAIDREPLTAAVAAERARGEPNLRIVCADALRPPFAERSFDVVTASLFLHHFAEREIVELLGRFLRLARRAVVINDLRRHRLPWLFIWVASRVGGRHPMYVHDAPLSVLRGFTAAELADVARDSGVPRFELRRSLPYRLVLTLPVEDRRP